MRIYFFERLSGIILIALIMPGCVCAIPSVSRNISGLQWLKPGIPRRVVLKHFPKSDERTYRVDKEEEFLTFNLARAAFGKQGSAKLVTFHLRDKKVMDWEFDNRQEVVREYLSEFCSQGFRADSSGIYQAIERVMARLPDDIFLLVTEREYPVLFTEYHYTSLGRLANSGEIKLLTDDPPTFMKGFYLVKLSTELEEAEVEVAEAIVAHELAHRVLGHSGSGNYTKDMESAANGLIKEWGFDKEFEKARKRFNSE